MTKHNIDEIKSLITEEIRKEGKWINKAEIARRIGIPRTSLVSRGIDSDVISAELGFPRKYINPKGSKESRNSVIQPLIDKYKAMIREAGRPVTLYQFASSQGMTEIGQMSRLYRYGIDWVQLHRECGIEWHLNKKMTSIGEAESILRSLISEKKRYVTRDELGSVLGVSGSSLSFHGLAVDKINYEYGFVADGRGYEFRILEMLEGLFPEASFELQKTFEDCRTSIDSRSKLRFDFYSPELNCLFEIDGPQHFDPTHFWYDEALLKRDQIKTEYAKSKNIPLIRIKYDLKIDSEALKNLLSGTPLKPSVGKPAAKPEMFQEGPETIRKE